MTFFSSDNVFFANFGEKRLTKAVFEGIFPRGILNVNLANKKINEFMCSMIGET